MIKYKLPSGKAGIQMTSLGLFAEKEYTYPMKKKDVEAALREALELLARMEQVKC